MDYNISQDSFICADPRDVTNQQLIEFSHDDPFAQPLILETAPPEITNIEKLEWEVVPNNTVKQSDQGKILFKQFCLFIYWSMIKAKVDFFVAVEKPKLYILAA